jgi:sigma-B regulation protein RsbU (phosphoserine phosphatase)
VGEDLAKDNDSCMFVTIFCAVLDMRTGGLRYASAGHNPPLLMRAGSGPEYLPSQSEPVAGAMPGLTYTTQALTLVPGDAILLYTDGVTEARTPDRTTSRSSSRSAARLAAPPAGSDARRLCEGLAAEVHAFARGAEQSDDITMLVLRYLGTGKNPG